MISVLIRTGDDYRVFKCIDSIKKTSPTSKIVISLTHDNDLEKRVAKLGIDYCVVPKKNGSITTNKGLELIKSGKVVVTDCDSVFDKGCIKLLDMALEQHDVVKPTLTFYNDGTLKSRLIANLRTYFNSKSHKMFTPGLAFNLSIKNKVGGYYFDEKVPWGEDSEFSNRIKKNRLDTFVEKKARLFHPPIGITHDLASAFLIGAKKPETKSLSEIISKRLVTYDEIQNTFGLSTLIYGLIWYIFFDFGKLSKYMGKVGEKIQNRFWKL